MSSASAFQPLPKSLAAQMSEGYAFEMGKHVAKPFEYVLAAAGYERALAAPLPGHAGWRVDGQRVLTGVCGDETASV